MPTDQFEDYINAHRDEFEAEAPAPDLWDRIEESIEETEEESDPLRDFVLTNREAFDDRTPPPRLAGRIFAELGDAPAGPRLLRTRKKTRLGLLMGIAASVAILLSLGWFLGQQSGFQRGQEAHLTAQLEAISPELAETEAFYREEIATQFTKVNLINQDPQLRVDLKAIDEATAEIRAALLEVPISQRPELINQLIETYQTKLDILVRIQQHIAPSPARTQLDDNNENI